jgi:HTH-type transcriptional regulator/antitoxin MqsA
MNELCYACDREAVLVREPREVLIGQRAVTVEGEFMRCPECGEAFFLAGQADAMQRLAADQIRREDGLLTAGEVKAFRTRLMLSQADFERLLGTGPKTVVRWERGTVTQSATADTLMRVLMKHPEALHDLALERSVRIDTRYFGESLVPSEPITARLFTHQSPMSGISLSVGGARSKAMPNANAAFSLSA